MWVLGDLSEHEGIFVPWRREPAIDDVMRQWGQTRTRSQYWRDGVACSLAYVVADFGDVPPFRASSAAPLVREQSAGPQ